MNAKILVAPILFGKALGTIPDFWLKLETTYQLKTFNTVGYHIEDIPLLVDVYAS